MAYTNERRDRTVVGEEEPFHRRISWGAIIAGFILALVVSLALNLLGVGIGISSIDPMQSTVVPSSIGTGAIIWYAISTVLALIAGGWVAGRLAGIPRKPSGALHGILTWCLFTIFSFYLLTTTVGRLIGITGNIVGQTFSTIGQGISSLDPNLGQLAQQELQQSDITLQGIRQEAEQLLRQTNDPDLQPSNLEQDVNQAQNRAQNVAQNPGQIGQVITRIFNKGDSIVSDVDRQDLVNVVAAQTNMSEAEAERTADRWINQYQQVKQQFAQFRQEAGAKAEQVAADVTSALSTAAIVAFIGMVLGAVAGAIGGTLGIPKDTEKVYA